MANVLNEKEQKLLNIIIESINTKGYPPTIRELAPLMGLSSTSSIHRHIEKLKEKGYIENDPTKPRTIVLAKRDDVISDFIQIPLVGTVAAGQPILAEENIEDYIPLPVVKQQYSNKDMYALKVKGENMINVGIFPNDVLIVERCDMAENGEIVIALTENYEATVKRFFAEDGHYRLQPENDTMEPIILDTVTILGKVVGVMRVFK